MDYDEKTHVKGLLEILSREDTCTWCPARVVHMMEFKGKQFMKFDGDWCRVCTGFVGVLPIKGKWAGSVTHYVDCENKCPCFVLGPNESLKRTWIALEAGGYLD